jgi:hypothetical protein
MKTYLSEQLPQMRLSKIEQLLRGQALTAQEIADGVFLASVSTLVYIRQLKDAGRIYISGWVRRGSACPQWVAQYRWGSLPDKPKPAAKTGKEKCADHRERVAADPDRYDIYLSRRRALKNKSRDPLVSALFGGVA